MEPVITPHTETPQRHRMPDEGKPKHTPQEEAQLGYGAFPPKVWLLTSDSGKQHVVQPIVSCDTDGVVCFISKEDAETYVQHPYHYGALVGFAWTPTEFKFDDARAVVKSKPESIKVLALLDPISLLVIDVCFCK